MIVDSEVGRVSLPHYVFDPGDVSRRSKLVVGLGVLRVDGRHHLAERVEDQHPFVVICFTILSTRRNYLSNYGLRMRKPRIVCLCRHFRHVTMTNVGIVREALVLKPAPIVVAIPYPPWGGTA